MISGTFKLLVIVAVLTTVNSVPQLLDNVRSMHDPDQFRSSLLKYLRPWTLRIAYTFIRPFQKTESL